jgi:type III secretion protein V
MNRMMDALPFRDAARHPDVILSLFIASIVAMLIIPMPTFLIDILLSVNIGSAFLILVVALFARNALEVSTFPSLLLISTLFRLALNVSTTRAILTHGEAGEVVASFGRFVVQGDLVVGLVIFLVITLVQFLVVAKGSERVAEVAARFTLDAMPGKQMSIDAALRAGALSEQQAQHKRDELSRESQLFGAMDGAMKYVKGDAIAGLLITGINLIGGFLIGVLRRELSAGDAAEVYSILTIGDALVSQIPALLVTLGSGILVTRVESRNKRDALGGSMKSELFSKPKVLFIAAALCGTVAAVPGLPTIPFMLIAALFGCIGVAHQARQRSQTSANVDAEEYGEPSRSKQVKAQKSITDRVNPSVVPISIDLDPELTRALGLEEDDSSAELITVLLPQLRDALYMETGVRFPAVRVRVMVPELAKGTFVVRLKDVPLFKETIGADDYLAVESPELLKRLDVAARPIKHPVTSAPVSLIRAQDREVVEASGVAVWNAAGIVALYLARALRRNAKSFVGLQEVGELVSELEKSNPTLIREVVPKVLSLSQLVDVLRRLVDEEVSIRDLKTILEALGERGAVENDVLALTEHARASLSRQLAHSYAGMENRLPVLLLDPATEDTIRSAIQQTKNGYCLVLEPNICRAVVQSIEGWLRPAIAAGVRPVILTNTEIRRFVRKLIESELGLIPVLSFDELPDDLNVRPIGRVSLPELDAA